MISRLVNLAKASKLFWTLTLSAVFSSQVLGQTTLTNGANHDASIAVGGQQSYKLIANAGDQIQLRVGATGFSPRIEVYAPGGALVLSEFTSNPNFRDALVETKLTGAGEYSVVVKSQYPAQSGNYRLAFAKSPGTFVVPSGDEGGPLDNGISSEATLTVGDLDMWSFTAGRGEGIIIRVGAIDFSPRIDLYGPDGTLLETEFTANSGFRDAVLYHEAPEAGSYTLVVSGYYLNSSGSYKVTLAKAPGPFLVGVDDQGGDLPNGVLKEGLIYEGDLDMWSFNAGVGDGIIIRAGTTSFSPRIDLYAPDGTLIESKFTANSGYRDVAVYHQAASQGTYIAVVSSYYLNDSGSYGITLAKSPGAFATAPGDEGGDLPNGLMQEGSIPVGDIDLWSFRGSAGDSIQLRIGTTTFSPRLDLYGPDGKLIMSEFTANSGYRDALLSAELTASGTFTVVVSSYYYNASGDYQLSLARAPGTFTTAPNDQGGALVNGGSQSGVLPVGDIDLWSFSGNTGEEIQIRVGATGFSPRIDLYGPNGKLLESAFTANSGFRDANLPFKLPSTGTYTVVVSSYYLNATGTYIVGFAKFPGEFQIPPDDEGGTLTNGVAHAGKIPVGDFDVWTFTGAPGNFVQLRVGATTFSPELTLYGPDGALLESVSTDNSGFRDASLIYRLTSSGTFSVVVSSRYLNAVGDYNLNFAITAGTVQTLPNDEGGQMVNGFVYNGTNSVGDLDVWQFYGTPGDSNVFRIGTIGFTPWLRLYDFNGELIQEVFIRNSGNRTNSMTFSVTNAGVYTLVSSAYFLNQSGTYNLKQSRVPPDLNVPATQEIDEATTLSVNINAQDPDDANKLLQFSLISAPPGVSLVQPIGTNATLTWITTEDHGLSTNDVVVTVTDQVDGKSFIRTNSFKVIVREINTAPHLTTPQAVTVDELTPVILPVSASDDDLPSNVLTFSLNNAPPGMTINPSTGVINWVPSEAAGPGNYSVDVVVSDENLIASNETHLSTTNRVNIQVREVNLRPVLTGPGAQTINELADWTITVTGTDPDVPPNLLSYALQSPPAGMTINAQTGVITWTPTEAQGPESYQISVVVSDNGNPSLTATNTFTVTVAEANTPPELQTIQDATLNFGSNLSIQPVGSDSDLPANILTYSLDQAPSGMTIDSSTGKISWTPTQNQVGKHVVVIRLADNAATPSSVTESFEITVTGVGTRLQISRVGNLAQLTITGDINQRYELQKTADLNEWQPLLEFQLTTSPYQYIDPEAATNPMRCYRLKLIP